MESRAADTDEAGFVQALKVGDQQAYERLIREHAGRMLAVARRLLGTEDEAQDALQDALISAVRSIHAFQGNARLGTWLHRIAVNAALMRLRSRRRHPERSIEDLLPRFGSDGHWSRVLPAWSESPSRLLEREETRAMVRRLIDDLPDDYRTVLVLRDIEGLSTQEAAEALAISAGAIKTRLHRARQALRRLLEMEIVA